VSERTPRQSVTCEWWRRRNGSLAAAKRPGAGTEAAARAAPSSKSQRPIAGNRIAAARITTTSPILEHTTSRSRSPRQPPGSDVNRTHSSARPARTSAATASPPPRLPRTSPASLPAQSKHSPQAPSHNVALLLRRRFLARVDAPPVTASLPAAAAPATFTVPPSLSSSMGSASR